ncbi:flippase-like domain-containing protein [Rubrobacter taiwanensis]|uniref:Flippase-like domain-containing protein n=1 Tax=Rubrobacter taiwanensis TaxID=185139 RepID=A0A4R1BTU0_9ACTN|nr:lysylphosphatidylglycerol synthase transmembrane domain-containing protein [Rubrobacter taiwanensis]TCJ20706.1 flippase-like domain-containing protein [Rubrobacter taiwanensis]
MRRPAFGLLLGVLLSLAALAAVGLRAGDGARMPGVNEWWPLALAVPAAGFGWLLHGLMLAVLVRPQLPDVRVRDMLRVHLGASFVGGVTPFGGAEVPYQIYMLRRLGLASGLGGAVMATKAMLNVSVIVFGGLLGLAFLSGLPPGELRTLLAAGGVVALVWLLIARLVRRPRRRRAARGGAVRRTVAGFVEDMKDGFVVLWRKEPRAVVLCAGLMVLYWAVYLTLGPLALMAAGWTGDWGPVITAQLLLYALLPLSPTPGGSGAAELGFAALVSPHVPGGYLLSGVLLWRGITYHLPLVLGAFLVGQEVGGGMRARG